MLLYADGSGDGARLLGRRPWPIARLPAVTTLLGLSGVPIVSIVTAAIALGEALTPSLLAAVVLVIGGVALGTIGGRTRPESPAVL